MAEEMKYDWKSVLKDKFPDKQFDIIIEKKTQYNKREM